MISLPGSERAFARPSATTSVSGGLPWILLMSLPENRFLRQRPAAGSVPGLFVSPAGTVIRPVTEEES